MEFEKIREWFIEHQDVFIKRGTTAMGMLMLIIALLYAVSIANDLGWL